MSLSVSLIMLYSIRKTKVPCYPWLHAVVVVIVDVVLVVIIIAVIVTVVATTIVVVLVRSYKL